MVDFNTEGQDPNTFDHENVEHSFAMLSMHLSNLLSLFPNVDEDSSEKIEVDPYVLGVTADRIMEIEFNLLFTYRVYKKLFRHVLDSHPDRDRIVDQDFPEMIQNSMKGYEKRKKRYIEVEKKHAFFNRKRNGKLRRRRHLCPTPNVMTSQSTLLSTLQLLRGKEKYDQKHLNKAFDHLTGLRDFIERYKGDILSIEEEIKGKSDK